MTRDPGSFNRRTALKKGGLMVSTFAVGLPIISGTAAADDPLLMDVDLPPVISSNEKGTIVTAIYPESHRGEGEVEDLEAEVLNHPEFKGFKLGPWRGEGVVDVAVDGADDGRYRLLPTGNMGCFSMPQQQPRLPGSHLRMTKQNCPRSTRATTKSLGGLMRLPSTGMGPKEDVSEPRI